MNKSAALSTGSGLPAHETAYRTLRDLVLFGALAPGDSVTIQGLIEVTGLGMTPIREALRRLTAEGALKAQDNRRIVVPVLDAAALEELRLARLLLEPRLAEKAAKRASRDDLETLQATDARLDTAIRKGDVGGYLRENHAFHQGLNAIADAPILASLSASLWLRFGPSLRVVCGQTGTRALPDRHKDIVAALSAADAQAAAQAVEEDIHQGMDMMVQSLPDLLP
ncbi:GntR family transcriptional regulator [Thalassococcus sp. CAU 1522]|uniref:GntR family transcriptional regulator n=1 Tax=Thalassococcus arenae TaxID=2851652 RepID=A0ABS6N5A1_9RHOB|nr:GntR family transcriptional regulator [Thalassococcus arenae]